MPVHCSAFGCGNRRTPDTRRRGITFHRFPKASDQRRKWAVALRRKGFTASNDSMLCSKHFQPEHFDRTGQTVRIRLGVVPSLFPDTPAHLRPKARPARTTATSRRAEQDLPLDLSSRLAPAAPAPRPPPQSPPVDHTYALSSCPIALKKGFIKARDNVIRLEREKRNAQKRWLREKSSLQEVLAELREKN